MKKAFSISGGWFYKSSGPAQGVVPPTFLARYYTFAPSAYASPVPCL